MAAPRPSKKLVLSQCKLSAIQSNLGHGECKIGAVDLMVDRARESQVERLTDNGESGGSNAVLFTKTTELVVQTDPPT